MYSFTDAAGLPAILVFCQCKRQYLVEEMYACFNCSYSFCRFCCVEEIQSYYCKNCLENTPYSSDIFGVQEHCSRCLECPNCLNNLSIIATSDSADKNKIWLYYHCNNCFWDSKTIGIIANKLEDLLESVRKKIKENTDPKNSEFSNIVTRYKDKFAEFESNQIHVTRHKKKSVTLLIAKSLSKSRGETTKRTLWSYADTEKAARDSEKKMIKDMNDLNIADKTLSLKRSKSSEEITTASSNLIYKDLYNEDFNSLEVAMENGENYTHECSMEQRMCHPINAQANTDNLYPLPVRLIPKRIRKCRKCMKNVVKPHSASTVSSEFQLLTLLAENFPKLTIKKLGNLVIGQECEVVMNFYNKTRNILHIEIAPMEAEQIQALNLSEYTLLSETNFSISSPMIPEEDPGKALTKHKFVHEVSFKIKVEDGEANKLIHFGFFLTSSIEIETDKIVLKIPIVIRLGNINKVLF